MPADASNRCAHFMLRKKRNCNLPPIPPSIFCTVHDPSYRTMAAPCNYCNTAIKPANLTAHIAVCPKASDVRRIESLPFFLRDINLKGDITPLAPMPDDCTAITELARCLHESLQLEASLWQEREAAPPETNSVRAHWNNARDSSVRYSANHFEQNAALAALLCTQSKIPTKASGNARPQSPLIGVVEMAAGRAYTSLFLAEVLRMRNIATKVVTIDRSCPRLGADRALRALEIDSSSDGSYLSFQRIKCDLKDFELSGVAALNDCTEVVMIGKHICGSALDMALIAIDRFARSCGRSKSISFALASCCRHRCSWPVSPAVAPVWKDKWNISETQFGAICRMSGWCLGCTDDEDAIHTGTLCQELVDSARVMWLRRQGWDAHLVRYVHRSVSPENIAIIGSWSDTTR